MLLFCQSDTITFQLCLGVFIWIAKSAKSKFYLNFDLMTQLNGEIEMPKQPNLKQKINTYRAKIRPLSDFFGID